MKWHIKILLLFILFSCIVSAEENHQLLIIKSADLKYYNDTVNGIIENLSNKIHYQVQSLHSNKYNQKTYGDADYIIAIGATAAKSILSNKQDKPVLVILTPKPTYKNLLQENQNQNTSTIFIDQPIERKISVIKKAFPKITKLAIVTSDRNGELYKIIEALKDSKLSINHKVIKNKNDIIPAFKEVSTKSELIFALPDPAVYNSDTIKSILISTYRNKIPIFGYSNALSKAGALISIFTPPYQIGKEAAEITNSFFKGEEENTNFEKYPKYFDVVVNERVARSLRININNIQHYRDRYLQQ